MTIEELGDILRDMREEEWGGGLSVAPHLFGIQYRKDIEYIPGSTNQVVLAIVRHAGIRKSLADEVKKGMRLEPNVELKNPYRP